MNVTVHESQRAMNVTVHGVTEHNECNCTLSHRQVSTGVTGIRHVLLDTLDVNVSYCL